MSADSSGSTQRPAGDEVPVAESTLLIDNDRVEVSRFRLAPGAHTGWHVHPMAYVIVPLTDGRMSVESKDGVAPVEWTAGVPYDRPAGVEHAVTNVGPADVVFIEIGMKAHPLE